MTKKLNLKSLKVRSFVTDDRIEELKGGNGTNTRFPCRQRTPPDVFTDAC